jgi:hypothetical protein
MTIDRTVPCPTAQCPGPVDVLAVAPPVLPVCEVPTQTPHPSLAVAARRTSAVSASGAPGARPRGGAGCPLSTSRRSGLRAARPDPLPRRPRQEVIV